MLVDVNLKICGLSRYNFVDEETKRSIQGCKLNYYIMQAGENSVGLKMLSVTVDYEVFEKFAGIDFTNPVDVRMKLDLSDLTKKPKVVSVDLLRK
ncbi:MAG: hypothetical protein ACI4OT_00260 [Bacilli bacterium]